MARRRLFAAWTENGTWQRLHNVLRGQARERDERDPQPSAAILDSRSVETSEGGEQTGYDAGTRAGRKWHLLVDTAGCC